MSNAENCMALDFSEELECPVCLDAWKHPIEAVPCGHIYCKACLPSLLPDKLCAVCRDPITVTRCPNRTLVNLALNVNTECQRCGWRGRREASFQHTCDEAERLAYQDRIAREEEKGEAEVPTQDEAPLIPPPLQQQQQQEMNQGGSPQQKKRDSSERQQRIQESLRQSRRRLLEEPNALNNNNKNALSASYNTDSVMAFLFSPCGANETGSAPPGGTCSSSCTTNLTDNSTAGPSAIATLTQPPPQQQRPPQQQHHMDPQAQATLRPMAVGGGVNTNPTAATVHPNYYQQPIHRPGHSCVTTSGSVGSAAGTHRPEIAMSQTQPAYTTMTTSQGSTSNPYGPGYYYTTSQSVNMNNNNNNHHHHQNNDNSNNQYNQASPRGPQHPPAASGLTEENGNPYGLTSEELEQQLRTYEYYRQEHMKRRQQQQQQQPSPGINVPPPLGLAGLTPQNSAPLNTPRYYTSPPTPRQPLTGGPAQHPHHHPHYHAQQPPQNRYGGIPSSVGPSPSSSPPSHALQGVIHPPPGHSQPWILYRLTQEEYDQMVSLFVFFDQDESGDLNPQELTRLARWLNFANSPQEAERIFISMDLNRDGRVSQAEFLTWLRYNRPDPQALYGLTQAQYNTIMMQFQMYDRDQDGMLNREDFVSMVMHLGDVRRPEDGFQLFRRIDIRNRGAINLHEFLRFRAGYRDR